jgi:hypothetical protein
VPVGSEARPFPLTPYQHGALDACRQGNLSRPDLRPKWVFFFVGAAFPTPSPGKAALNTCGMYVPGASHLLGARGTRARRGTVRHVWRESQTARSDWIAGPLARWFARTAHREARPGRPTRPRPSSECPRRDACVRRRQMRSGVPHPPNRRVPKVELTFMVPNLPRGHRSSGVRPSLGSLPSGPQKRLMRRPLPQ